MGFGLFSRPAGGVPVFDWMRRPARNHGCLAEDTLALMRVMVRRGEFERSCWIPVET